MLPAMSPSLLTQMSQLVIGAADLGAAFLFLFGLKRMSR